MLVYTLATHYNLGTKCINSNSVEKKNDENDNEETKIKNLILIKKPESKPPLLNLTNYLTKSQKVTNEIIEEEKVYL